MFKRQILVRSALACAVFSATLVSIPAHAGLLGGSSSAVGGLAGGANFGGMAMGQGAFSNNGSLLQPRGERALQSARQITVDSQAAGQGAATKGNTTVAGTAMGAAQAASDMPAASTGQVNTAQQGAASQASGQGGKARQGLFGGSADAQGGLLSSVRNNTTSDSSGNTTAPGTTPAAGKPLSVGGSGSGDGEASVTKSPATTTAAPAQRANRGAQLTASGSGSRQASQDGAQVRGDASAQGSVSR